MAVIGIDLGTTNSAMAIYRNGRSEIVLNGSDQRTTPSVYQLKPNGEEIIGSSAKKGALSLPRHTVMEVKRLMGKDEQITVGERKYRPEEISSKILAYFKKSAEEKLREEVTEAVVTVPAYFSDAQRKATKIAGELAGLKVERIINEPTAAALAYCHEHMDKNQHVLVYDLGGGTFDVSIVELFEGVVEVKASAGDNFLGGTDFDEAIMNMIKADFTSEKGYAIDEVAFDSDMLYFMLKEAAENAKIDLSTQLETEIMLPLIGMRDNVPVSHQMKVTRSRFEDVIRDQVNSTLDKINLALSDADLVAEDISEILMVGGSTRIPLVRESMEREFKKTVRTDLNPDEVVAIGAAVQAAIKSGEIDSTTGLMAIDVCPYTLGTEVNLHVNGRMMDGFFDPIIHRNSTIPVSETKLYYTANDYQEVVDVSVYQGEGRFISETELVSDDLKLDGIPRDLAGRQSLEVTFNYDINGLIQVDAKILSTGKKVTQVIQYQPGVMSDKEIDQSFARLENERVDSELLASVHALTLQAKRKMEHNSPEKNEIIGGLLTALTHAIETGNIVLIKKLEQQLSSLL
ncbi:Hsp70 family protein [Bacillus sp. FSL K6-3431]|uniref:Hsp70 family protein n=1 Tax=Bacillus sp. FSL K6-3431 TaxID=2921500 RepID=UPI0030F64D40